jgi:protein gp37
MAQTSDIQWTDASWTPIRARVKADAGGIARQKGYSSLVRIADKMAGRVGPHCEHMSPGCTNCYSASNNQRCLPENGTGLPFDRRSRDLVDIFLDEKILAEPLRWKRPRKIFVCSQTDLFGGWVPDEMIDAVFAVMALCPQHTFQVLTKQADRMLRWFDVVFDNREHAVAQQMANIRPQECALIPDWPLPNVWLGVSTENQSEAEHRIDKLMLTPAAIRFISYEPALGPLDIRNWLQPSSSLPGKHVRLSPGHWIVDKDGAHLFWRGLDWVIAGGESGREARPSHPDWFRSVLYQCAAVGVPYFFKQWGAYGYATLEPDTTFAGGLAFQSPRGGRASVERGLRLDEKTVAVRMKKQPAPLLDGNLYQEFPLVSGDSPVGGAQ